MQKAVFFILSESPQASEQHQAVAQICCALYDKNKRCSVFCDSQTQAEIIDEVLWQLPSERFIPHKIGNEGDNKPAPIEINWQIQPRWSANTLINLTTLFHPQMLKSPFIYDFVPSDEAGKQQARERYKHYRSGGFALETHPFEKLQEILNGQDL